MNALFDEQNNVVAEHSAETIIPEWSNNFIEVIHESLFAEPIEKLLSNLGATVHDSLKVIK